MASNTPPLWQHCMVLPSGEHLGSSLSEEQQLLSLSFCSGCGENLKCHFQGKSGSLLHELAALEMIDSGRASGGQHGPHPFYTGVCLPLQLCAGMSKRAGVGSLCSQPVWIQLVGSHLCPLLWNSNLMTDPSSDCQLSDTDKEHNVPD